MIHWAQVILCGILGGLMGTIAMHFYLRWKGWKNER